LTFLVFDSNRKGDYVGPACLNHRGDALVVDLYHHDRNHAKGIGFMITNAIGNLICGLNWYPDIFRVSMTSDLQLLQILRGNVYSIIQLVDIGPASNTNGAFPSCFPSYHFCHLRGPFIGHQALGRMIL
jgi:hypothetical protein